MHGPEILARTLSLRAEKDASGNAWQYHPRSDHHSKVACWGILFDFLGESPVLRKHVESGAVVYGINHEMRDFKQNRKKDLDLVLARPRDSKSDSARGFKSLVERYQIVLTKEQKQILADLPDIRRGEVGAVQVALEAKACMTAHVKALPRLYDELNSSHETTHASADVAIAVGFVMINAALEFLSPGRQVAAVRKAAAKVNRHKQPDDTKRVVDKVHEMPRRTKPGEQGFDAMGIVIIECRNDGTPVRLVTTPPAPKPGDIYDYESMVRRLTQLYASRFAVL
ncbi:MAG: hypothetical protein ABIT01_16025 [Thermoanaerobaculia bacterium]